MILTKYQWVYWSFERVLRNDQQWPNSVGSSWILDTAQQSGILLWAACRRLMWATWCCFFFLFDLHMSLHFVVRPRPVPLPNIKGQMNSSWLEWKRSLCSQLKLYMHCTELHPNTVRYLSDNLTGWLVLYRTLKDPLKGLTLFCIVYKHSKRNTVLNTYVQILYNCNRNIVCHVLAE